ncbi:hypothetical protein RIF29_27907 [Crotalaria pallida]|uniref:Basic blue protein n=1 Tax=Crotalaria pallida TaxID=3830 RepID=A0AAN9HZ71_CROPI
MSQEGRGNNAMVAIIMILFTVLVFHSDIVHAVTYKVGDERGWAGNVVNWPQGKQFKAGDMYEFRYDPKLYNIVQVDEAGYNSCTTKRGDREYQTGLDFFQFPRGNYYFICSVPGRCQAGTKVALHVL